MISSASLSFALPSRVSRVSRESHVSERMPNPRTVSEVDVPATNPIDESSRLSLFFFDVDDLLLLLLFWMLLFDCCSESLAVGSGAPKSSDLTLKADTEPALELDGDTGLLTIGVPVRVV